MSLSILDVKNLHFIYGICQLSNSEIFTKLAEGCSDDLFIGRGDAYDLKCDFTKNPNKTLNRQALGSRFSRWVRYQDKSNFPFELETLTPKPWSEQQRIELMYQLDPWALDELPFSHDSEVLQKMFPRFRELLNSELFKTKIKEQITIIYRFRHDSGPAAEERRKVLVDLFKEFYGGTTSRSEWITQRLKLLTT